ncbi:MAG: DUF4384 domain-containing protein [Myxococcales bacterium]|nr:DUF4384 domain-containing protein [Myxococcales bacterium]
METETTGEMKLAEAYASRRLGRECLSDLQLDQLALGELGGVEGDRARLHVTQCPVCEAAHNRLEEERRRFSREVDVSQVAAAILQASHRVDEGVLRRGLRSWILPSAVTAAAFGGLLLLARPVARPVDPRPAAEAGAEAVRAKGGGFALATYVLYAGQEQPGTLHLGEALRAGDRVQFRVTAPRDSYLAVLSVDPQGEVSVFHPPGPEAAFVPAGRDLPLGTAVELDAGPGPETVVALFCDEPRLVADLVQALAPGAPSGSAEGPHVGRLPCTEVRTRLPKAPSPP